MLGADGSDQAGARVLCEPLKERFPTIKLMWGDSHYGGTFITWLKERLGWTMQTVRAHRAQAGLARARRRRGRLGEALSLRLSSLAQKMGGGTDAQLDEPLSQCLDPLGQKGRELFELAPSGLRFYYVSNCWPIGIGT